MCDEVSASVTEKKVLTTFSSTSVRYIHLQLYSAHSHAGSSAKRRARFPMLGLKFELYSFRYRQQYWNSFMSMLKSHLSKRQKHRRSINGSFAMSISGSLSAHLPIKH
ncbi:unnamed protein product [Heterosigma akashiwo]